MTGDSFFEPKFIGEEGEFEAVEVSPGCQLHLVPRYQGRERASIFLLKAGDKMYVTSVFLVKIRMVSLLQAGEQAREGHMPEIAPCRTADSMLKDVSFTDCHTNASVI